MGLQEIDIFQDWDDSEKFAAGIKTRKTLKETLRDLFKGVVVEGKAELLPEEDDALKLTDEELL